MDKPSFSRLQHELSCGSYRGSVAVKPAVGGQLTLGAKAVMGNSMQPCPALTVVDVAQPDV